MINLNIKTKEKGQTLLFVIVAVTIALAIGVSVSTRTLNSLRRVSRSDTSSRAIAAAEGGIENLLNKNYDQLDSAVNPSSQNMCMNSIGADYEVINAKGTCVYNFPITGEDNINSRAVVTVEKFRSNDGNGYSFSLEPDSVKEVNLSGYSGTAIQLCWSDTDNKTAIYYSLYNRDGEVKKGGFYKTGFVSASSTSSFTEISSNCSNIDVSTTALNPKAYGIRIRVLYNSARVTVNPVGSGIELPYQGYKFISVGEVLSDSKSKQPEVATVTVYKSYPYVSGVFDFGIYTNLSLQ